MSIDWSLSSAVGSTICGALTPALLVLAVLALLDKSKPFKHHLKDKYFLFTFSGSVVLVVVVILFIIYQAKTPHRSLNASCDSLTDDPDDIERRGIGHPIEHILDPAAALTACRAEINAADAAGHKEAIPRLEDQLARAIAASGNLQEAASYYEISAAGGYPSGMARYGLTILKASPEAAVDNFKKASGRSIIATFEMGDFYWSGFNNGLVPENETESMRLMKLAADMGFAPAMDHPAYKQYIRKVNK